MLIVFFRAVILYILIVISIRLMGKRQIGELQPSELVITLLLSNIATLPIEDMTIPMSMGIVPIFTLVCLDVILSHCSLKFRGLRKLICGSPKIVVSRGIIDQKTAQRPAFFCRRSFGVPKKHGYIRYKRSTACGGGNNRQDICLSESTV